MAAVLENSFGLFRILGNSLPPRHAASQTLELTEFILRNEPDFEGCRKCWILNRLVDPVHEEALLAMLRGSGHEVVVIPFDAQAHYGAFLDPSGIPGPFKAKTGAEPGTTSPAKVHKLEWLLRHKSQALININHARNIALKIGRERFRWTLPLDGGVMFSQAGWQDFAGRAMEERVALFAVLPMTRVHDRDRPLETIPYESANEEPQVAFRSDSRAAFDERLRYGNQNKVELLKRIGVPGVWDTWPGTPWEELHMDAGAERGRFFTAGRVFRLPTGAAPETEQTNSSRWIARFQGVSELSRNIDVRFAAKYRRENPGWCVVRLPAALEPAARDALQAAAVAAMAERDISILDKARLAPSGNRQDYHSLAPYHVEGRRRDGLRRAESSLGSLASLDYDRTGMDRFCRRSTILAVAGKLLHDRTMLEAAARLIRMWLIDPATRMNPNLNHAQRIEGEALGRHRGIIDIRDMWFMPQTIELLGAERVLDAREIGETRNWCLALLQSISVSPQFAPLNTARNNIGTWAMAVVAALRLHCGQVEAAAVRLRDVPHFIAEQCGPLNMQMLEVVRTRPLHYSLFNLSGHAALTVLGWHVGLDLRSYRGVEGQNLEAAIGFAARNRDLFSDYANDPSGFDGWIEALTCVLGQDGPGRSTPSLMLDGNLGLPPLWPMLAPVRHGTGADSLVSAA